MRSLATAALIAALAVTACGGGSTPPPAGAANAVTIVDFAFQSSSLSVAKGTSVTWTNTGSVGHTVTADDASFTSPTIPGGGTFAHTFDTAGAFAYHCSIHSKMKATVTVTP